MRPRTFRNQGYRCHQERENLERSERTQHFFGRRSAHTHTHTHTRIRRACLHAGGERATTTTKRFPFGDDFDNHERNHRRDAASADSSAKRRGCRRVVVLRSSNPSSPREKTHIVSRFDRERLYRIDRAELRVIVAARCTFGGGGCRDRVGRRRRERSVDLDRGGEHRGTRRPRMEPDEHPVSHRRLQKQGGVPGASERFAARFSGANAGARGRLADRAKRADRRRSRNGDRDASTNESGALPEADDGLRFGVLRAQQIASIARGNRRAPAGVHSDQLGLPGGAHSKISTGKVHHQYEEGFSTGIVHHQYEEGFYLLDMR